MSRLRLLLRPGWIALALVVVVFAYLCFSILAPWQLGKNNRTSERNKLIADSQHAQVVPIDRVFTVPLDPKKEWTKVSVTGTFESDKQVLVRLQSSGGDPAYKVLVPFRAEDGRTYLVNRGYIKANGGNHVPAIPAAPTGTVTTDARIRMSEGSLGKPPIHSEGTTQVYSIDPAEISRLVGQKLAPGYLELLDNQPGALQVEPLPRLDSGPYLSYGLQWLAFGVMAPLALIYFGWAEVKQRRATKNTGSDESEGPMMTRGEARAAARQRHREQLAGISSDTASPRESKLADRYGH